MSSRSRRRKQRAASVLHPAKVAFPFKAVRMLKDALRLMDDAFTHNTEPLPNLKLGSETLEGLRTKLDDMLQCEDWDKETPFDANELHMLYAAIQMYFAMLSQGSNDGEMSTCLQLCKQLRAIVSALPLKHLPKR